MTGSGAAAMLAALTCAWLPVGASAQDIAATGGVVLPDSASPFGATTVTNEDAKSVTMPNLAFTPNATDAGDFDKYFVFHRADTDFATAYADVKECDGYARGLRSGLAYQQVPYPYSGTIGGAIGGALGNAMADAIYGSAERRKARRASMRACMGFKGYKRFGLPKALWTEFNFEEGLSSVDEDRRETCLRRQALVASSGNLQGKELEL